MHSGDLSSRCIDHTSEQLVKASHMVQLRIKGNEVDSTFFLRGAAKSNDKGCSNSRDENCTSAALSTRYLGRLDIREVLD